MVQNQIQGSDLSSFGLHRTLEQWVKKLKCSGSSGISLESFSDIKVGVDPSPITSKDKTKIFDITSDDDIKEKLGEKFSTTGSDAVTLDLNDWLTIVVRMRKVE